MAARGGKRDATAIDSSAGKAGNTRGWWLLFDSFLFLCTSHRRCEPHSAARTAGAIERGWPVGPSPPATPTLSATTVSLRRRRRRGPRPRHHHYHRLPPSPPPLLKTGCGTSPSPPGCHHGQTPAFPDVIKAADHVGGTAHLPPPTPLPLAPTPSPPSIRRRRHPTLLGTRPPFGRSQAGAAARSGYVAAGRRAGGVPSRSERHRQVNPRAGQTTPRGDCCHQCPIEGSHSEELRAAAPHRRAATARWGLSATHAAADDGHHPHPLCPLTVGKPFPASLASTRGRPHARGIAMWGRRVAWRRGRRAVHDT